MVPTISIKHNAGQYMFAFKKVITSILLLFVHVVYFTTAAHAEMLIDIGHTKSNYGAKSCSGRHEYEYNKDLVKHIIRVLKQYGIPCSLTNDYDKEIKLNARTRYSAGKDLLISIHHDSAQKKYIEYIDGNPCSDRFRGYSIFVSRKNPFFERSVRYARYLGGMLKSYGLQHSTHHNEDIKGENREFLDKELGIFLFDDLIVLKTAKCPAILLEAAVIIDPADDILSSSTWFRDVIAHSIAKTAIFANTATAD